MTVMQFSGMVISFLILSLFSDRYGRKNLIMMGLGICTSTMMVHSLVTNVALMGICRFLLGVSVGLMWGLPLILLIEIVPAKIRGRIVIAGEICFILGIIYMALSALVLFDSYTVGNWPVIL